MLICCKKCHHHTQCNSSITSIEHTHMHTLILFNWALAALVQCVQLGWIFPPVILFPQQQVSCVWGRRVEVECSEPTQRGTDSHCTNRLQGGVHTHLHLRQSRSARTLSHYWVYLQKAHNTGLPPWMWRVTPADHVWLAGVIFQS